MFPMAEAGASTSWSEVRFFHPPSFFVFACAGGCGVMPCDARRRAASRLARRRAALVSRLAFVGLPSQRPLARSADRSLLSALWLRRPRRTKLGIPLPPKKEPAGLRNAGSVNRPNGVAGGYVRRFIRPTRQDVDQLDVRCQAPALRISSASFRTSAGALASMLTLAF